MLIFCLTLRSSLFIFNVHPHPIIFIYRLFLLPHHHATSPPYHLYHDRNKHWHTYTIHINLHCLLRFWVGNFAFLGSILVSFIIIWLIYSANMIYFRFFVLFLWYQNLLHFLPGFWVGNFAFWALFWWVSSLYNLFTLLTRFKPFS